MNNQANQYDVVVVGAGLVGCSAVLAMQQLGLRVLVLEKHLPDVMVKPDPNSRPISLALGSQQILAELEVWPSLQGSACPIQTVHVSQQGRFGVTRFRASELDAPALGYVVPFSLLHMSLYKKMSALSNLSVQSIVNVQAVTHRDGDILVDVEYHDGVRQISTGLLIGADGARSQVRELLNIDTHEKNFNEIALTALIDLAAPHNCTAYERFTKKGTLAILPMPNRRQCRLVWTMPDSFADQVNEWSDDELLACVQQTFGQRLGRMNSIKKTARFPLQTIIAKEQCQQNAVLLGNSAHTIYPLAAQGFNLGLRDVVGLVAQLRCAQKNRQALGSTTVLNDYLNRRRSDQKRTMGLTQNLSNWFDLDLPLAGHLRGAGLQMLDMIPALKRRVARGAAGVG